MSGRRRRALKRAFLASYGRRPYKAAFDSLGLQVQRDELRAVKKAHVRGRSWR